MRWPCRLCSSPFQYAPATEIDEVRAERVFGENLVGLLLDQFALQLFAHLGVFLEALGLGRHLALVGQVLARQFRHFGLDLLEVFRRERLAAIEVVEETGVGGRADAELGLGIQFQHRGGEQVRARMTVDVQRLGVFGGQDLKRAVGGERVREVGQLAVDLGDHGVVGQPAADGPCDIERRGARSNFLLAPIGQGNGDFAHIR
jgi:hypothetical protein